MRFTRRNEKLTFRGRLEGKATRNVGSVPLIGKEMGLVQFFFYWRCVLRWSL